MFVSQSMTRKVITVSKEMTVLEAQALMYENSIRHLPVVEADNLLVGIITDRDIRSALPYRLAMGQSDPQERAKYAHLRVADVMSVTPATIMPTHTLQDALLLIQEKRVGAFPVVDELGRLKGIISVRDLLRAFINVLGIGEPGTLLCIIVENQVGQLKCIVDAITEEGISFGSVLVARYWEEGKRAVFPYLLTNNVIRIKKKLKDMGYTLLDPMKWYMDQLPKSE
ncbi:MAG: CBS and ACT domain-containing protein [Desulfobacteraceae bacterium]|nr:CBS and ACT domain-containing protein [Desulfobacteraceae bacterium]